MLPARKNIALPGEFKDLDSKDYLNLKPLSSGELENSLALWKKSISR